MGLTVHYSGGRAKSRSKIDDCLDFAVDVAKRLPCKITKIDERLTGKLEDWRKPKNPLNGKVVTVHQKGVVLWVDEGSEPLKISFDYDSLEFCDYLKFSKQGNLNKSGFFCKTQFSKNFLRTHNLVCRLLETIKHKYVSGLRVSDEAQYYGKWDQNKLKQTYEEWSGLISAFGKALGKIEFKPGADVEKIIIDAAKEVHRDHKLKKTFG